MKEILYGQVARIGQVFSSPKRLELVELLCQGEKSVERLANEAGISLKLASAHLKELRHAHLVEARKEGKNTIYRLASEEVADFWVTIRTLAEDRLVDLRVALAKLSAHAHELTPLSRVELLAQAQGGEVTVLDVRPSSEFITGHLPYAQSIPLADLKRRLEELPSSKPIVAYCRGPFCLMAVEAVEMLRQEGFNAIRLEDGVAEWRTQGLPLEVGA